MKAKIKKFGYEIKEWFTATIQIDKKLRAMKDQYTIKLWSVQDQNQLLEIKGWECVEFDGYVLRWESLQNSMILKIKIDQKVIHFLASITAKWIEECWIELL